MSHFQKSRVGLVLLASCITAFAQQTKTDSNPQPGLEFPAALQRKVVAGSTPVGFVVNARLTMATLIDGVVIPENAVIIGHVEKSVAKTADAPSVIEIKFDSARWKKGSAPLNLYLAGAYYPIEFRGPGDDPSGIHGEVGLTMGGAAQRDPFPSANGGIQNGTGMSNSGGVPTVDANRQGFPDSRTSMTTSEVSKHWVRLENVDTVSTAEGSLQITSKERNLKLDKGTIYLLRTAPVPAAK